MYECLQRFLRDSPAPALDYASGLSLQVMLDILLYNIKSKLSEFDRRICGFPSVQLLIDIRSLPGCSEEAKELYRLLRQPHLQVTRTPFARAPHHAHAIRLLTRVCVFSRLCSRLTTRSPRGTTSRCCRRCPKTCRTTRRPPGSSAWSKTNSLW